MNEVLSQCIKRLPKNILSFLSYIVEIPVDSIASKISDRLIVKRFKNKIIVDTSLVNYSFGSLHEVFQIAFEKIQPFEKLNIQKVLILGFGAGSVYEILRKEMGYTGEICGVDIDEEMIGLFKKYYFKQDPFLELLQQDAVSFIQSSSNQYDLMVIDLFIQDNLPEGLTNEDFLHALSNRLTPDSILIWNMIVSTENQKQIFKTIQDFLEIGDHWFNVGSVNRIFYKIKSSKV